MYIVYPNQQDMLVLAVTPPFIFASPLGKCLTVAWVLKYLGASTGALLILSKVHVGASLGCRKSDAVASSHGTVSP